MWVASTHSRAGLIKLEEQGWVFLWILYDPQSPRPHGDMTPVRPHKVSHKVRKNTLKYVYFFSKMRQVSYVPNSFKNDYMYLYSPYNVNTSILKNEKNSLTKP